MRFLMLKKKQIPPSPGCHWYRGHAAATVRGAVSQLGPQSPFRIQAVSPLSFSGPFPAMVPPKVVKIGITLPLPAKLEWSELANKNIRCPVQFEF